MNRDEAERAIRAEMASVKSEHARSFWKGVLVGLGCGINLNFSLPLMKDLADAQGTYNDKIATP